MPFKECVSSVRTALDQPSAIVVSFAVLVLIHVIAARHPPELFRDRVGPLLHEFWSPPAGRGYPERPIVYRVARIRTPTGSVMVSDDVHADYESAIRHAIMQRTEFTEYAAYRRTNTYGLWFGSIRVRGWDVYRVRRDLSPVSISLSELMPTDPIIRLFAAHPQLPGKLPLRVVPLPGAFGDLLGLIFLATCFIGVKSVLFRMCSAVWSRWRAVPHGHCQNCGYDLTGLPAPVCPECGGRMNSVSHP